MGLLDEISGLFSNTESLFQSSDQKSDQTSVSTFNSVTGGAVHLARSAVVEGLSFIPGVGSYALIGKTFWSLYRGQYSDSVTNLEALISYLPFGALEQLATGAYSLFTGKNATTKKDVSRFEAALQMAFGAFGLACDVRGFKASRLKLGEFLNRETARLLNPFHSLGQVRVPHMEVAGVPGLRMGGFGNEVEDTLNVRNVFMAGEISSRRLNLDGVSFENPGLGRVVSDIIDNPHVVAPDVEIQPSLGNEIRGLVRSLSLKFKELWRKGIRPLAQEEERKIETYINERLLALGRVSGGSRLVISPKALEETAQIFPIYPRLAPDVEDTLGGFFFSHAFGVAKWNQPPRISTCRGLDVSDLHASNPEWIVPGLGPFSVREVPIKLDIDFNLSVTASEGGRILKRGVPVDSSVSLAWIRYSRPGKHVIEEIQGDQLGNYELVLPNGHSRSLGLHLNDEFGGDFRDPFLAWVARELERRDPGNVYLRKPTSMHFPSALAGLPLPNDIFGRRNLDQAHLFSAVDDMSFLREVEAYLTRLRKSLKDGSYQDPLLLRSFRYEPDTIYEIRPTYIELLCKMLGIPKGTMPDDKVFGKALYELRRVQRTTLPSLEAMAKNQGFRPIAGSSLMGREENLISV